VSSLWRLQAVAIVFFLTIATLTAGLWEAPYKQHDLLDIRNVNVNTCGRQILVAYCLLAATDAQSRAGVLSGLVVMIIWMVGWIRFFVAQWFEVFRIGGTVSLGVLILFSAEAAGVTLASFFVVVVIYNIVSDWTQRRSLREAGVERAMKRVNGIHQQLALWGDYEGVRSLKIDASPQNAANQVLWLERQLPVGTLSLDFLMARNNWIENLQIAERFDEVIWGLESLERSIQAPCTRMLMTQLLGKITFSDRRKTLPRFLINEVVSFAYKSCFVETVDLPKGWEVGKIRLKDLRSEAKTKAKQVIDNFRRTNLEAGKKKTSRARISAGSHAIHYESNSPVAHDLPVIVGRSLMEAV